MCSWTANGARLTDTCTEGFTGILCSSLPGRLLHRQPSAASLADYSRRTAKSLSSSSLSHVSIFSCMAVCVAIMSPARLSTAVSGLLLLQHLSVIGKLGASQVPSSMTWLSELFGVVSLLNWEPGFVKAGCVTPQLPFLAVYAATLVLVCLTSGLFAVASFIRAKRPWRKWLRDGRAVEALPSVPPSPSSAARSTGDGVVADMPWQWRFKARLTHSHLILGSILYLRLTTLNLQALHCTDVQLTEGGSLQSVLAVDLSTRCYQGAHLVVSVLLVWPGLLVFSLGFPLFSALLLYRTFHGAASRLVNCEAGTERKTQELSSVNCLSKGTRQGLHSPADSGSGWTSPVAVSAPTSPLAVSGSRSWSGMRPLLVHKAVESSFTFRVLPSSRVQPADEGGRKKEEGADVEGMGSPLSMRPGQWSADQAVAPVPAGQALHWRGKILTPPLRLPATARPAFSAEWEPRIGQREVKKVSAEEPTEGEPSIATKPTGSPLRTHRPLPLLSSTAAALRLLVKDERRQEWFGFLYRQLKGELYFFRLLLLASSFAFACVSVLPSSATVRLFSTGVVFSCGLSRPLCGDAI